MNELRTLRQEMDEAKEWRRAFDDSLYGKGEKEDKERAVFPRIQSLERDRNLLRWFIAIAGGIFWTKIVEYVPWLAKGAPK